MSKHIQSPIQYCSDNIFNEGRLISFDYSGKDLDIVLEYMSKKEAGDSSVEFRLLNFVGIDEYKRELGKGKELQRTEIDYLMANYEGVHVVQELNVQVQDGRYYMDLWIDYSLGRHPGGSVLPNATSKAICTS